MVYQQSLEHYRNDTKLEYRDLKERITKETGVVRSLTQEFYHNLTSESRQMVSHLNTSINRQIEDVKQRMQVKSTNDLFLKRITGRGWGAREYTISDERLLKLII